MLSQEWQKNREEEAKRKRDDEDEKWADIVALALKGDLTALAQRYPHEAVLHFSTLKEIALTCATLPFDSTGGQDERWRDGKVALLYEGNYLCSNRVNKKQRLEPVEKQNIAISRFSLHYCLLDNERCDLCQRGGLHTTANFDYTVIHDDGDTTIAVSSPDQDEEDDCGVMHACIECTRAFTRRDPEWKKASYWTEEGHSERRHAYDIYRTHGLVDDLGLM